MPSKKANINEIQGAIDAFVSGLPAMEKSEFNKVYAILKELKLDGAGNIQSTISNLKIINKVKLQLESIVSSDQYIDKVAQVRGSIENVSSVQSQYFTNTFESYAAPKLIPTLEKIAFSNTAESLAGAGVNTQVISFASDIVEQHIRDNSSWGSMVDQLRTAMVSSPEVPSRLVSYAKGIINDELSSFARSFNKSVTDDLGLEWYEYLGPLITTSRPFCIALVEKHYVHKSELGRIAGGNISGQQVSLAGVMPGTNGSNLIDRCGGFNCSHQLIPIPSNQVPIEIRKRFEKAKAKQGDEPIVVDKQAQKVAAQKLMVKAQASAPELENMSKSVAMQNGAYVTPTNFKSEDSILRKANDEELGDIGKINDAVRNTIIVKKSKISDVVEQLKADYSDVIVKHKVQLPEKYMGYSGDLFNVKFKNGTIGEIQVNTPQMIFGKEKPEIAKKLLGEDLWLKIEKDVGVEGGLGHKYYEEIREITDAVIEKNPKMKLRKIELEKLSNEYYDKIRG